MAVKRNKNLRHHIIVTSISFFALVLAFVAGIFHPNTVIEKNANYASEIVMKNTDDGDCFSINICSSDNSSKLLDFETEFLNLYGVFSQRTITFASSINPEKNHNIEFSSIKTENLSVLYIGSTGTIEYNGHYKLNLLPIEVMFKDADTYDISDYKAYISEEHACQLLESQGFLRGDNDSFSEEQFEKLLRQTITINIDENPFDFVIQNIYYQSNYYYDGIDSVMGDFIMASYYFPLNLRREQQNMYFFNKYPYQNKYLMNYIKAAYSSNDFNASVNHYNLNGSINDEALLSFYHQHNSQNNFLPTFLFSVSTVLLIASFLYCVYIRRILFDKSKLFTIIHIFILFVPYLLFYLLFVSINSTSLFSDVSCRFNLFAILIYTTLFISLEFLPFRIKTHFKNRHQSSYSYYELHI